MFYCDENIIRYESERSFNDVLLYLEKKFLLNKDEKILSSLIGFAWLYDLEPFFDECTIANVIWEKYIRIAIKEYRHFGLVSFIVGFALSINGFYISEFSDNHYEESLKFLRYSYEKCDGVIRDISNALLNPKPVTKKFNIDNYKSVVSYETLQEYFYNNTSLEDYFRTRKY